MTLTARQKSIAITTVVMLSGATLAGVAIGLVRDRDLPPSIVGVLAAMALAGAFLATLPRWHRLDHMQQDSRLLSWYWGGGFGGGLGLVLALLFGGGRSPLFAGAALVWLLQFAGYVVFRLRWWLAHRPQGS